MTQKAAQRTTVPSTEYRTESNTARTCMVIQSITSLLSNR